MSFRPTLLLLGCGIWLTILVTGFGALEVYSSRPGAEEHPLGTIAALASPPGKTPLLRMFIHPRCPCTRTSLNELARVLERVEEPIAVEVVVIRPPESAPGWEQTEIVRAAERIPGVRIVIDANGEEAKRYGAKTSGYVVLFNRQGEPVFHGGVTRARGHAGNNLGSESLLALLQAKTAPCDTTPTYGCPLLTPAAPPCIGNPAACVKQPGNTL